MAEVLTREATISTLDRLLNHVDKVQAMRMLERKQEATGLSEQEFFRLCDLKNIVDAFYMLPPIPRALAQ